MRVARRHRAGLQRRSLRRGVKRRAHPIYRLLVLSDEGPRAEVDIAPNGLVRALSYFDGPVVRHVRELIHAGSFPADVGVMILTADYGLIQADTMIRPYDGFMTQQLSVELVRDTREQLSLFMDRQPVRDVLGLMGHLHRQCLRLPQLARARPGVKAGYASGHVRTRVAWLEQWLKQGRKPRSVR